MRTLVLVIFLLVAIALAGCTAASSTGSFSGAEKDVANAIEDLQTAAQRDDETRICRDLVARPVLDKLRTRTPPRPCTAVVAQALDDQDSTELTVKDVRVTGTTARARVELGRDKDRSTVMTLRREGSAWKIETFAGR
jgi:hypothetical protein